MAREARIEKVYDNLPRVASNLGGWMHDRMDEAFKTAADAAVRAAPVGETGELAAGIGYQLDGTTGSLYSNAWYSGYVEYGTSRMGARPFMTPAAEVLVDTLMTSMQDNKNDLTG
jgi:HK97 gp10 family phage protein